MNIGESYSIRPAGRHILTIGRDLIQDQYAAIVELVKNAYDADSPDVIVTFNIDLDKKEIEIKVEDHGHGMSRDIVIDKWLVPSTDDKLKRRESPKGRIMQGRKGVGRYATSILGDDLLLETITNEGEKTTVYAEWKCFEQSKYLDDVEVLVQTESTNSLSGTILTIKGGKQHLDKWDKKQIEKLNFELKKLISPVGEKFSDNSQNDPFSIIINSNVVLGGQKIHSQNIVKPYPIMELFDYQISGSISQDGKGILTYINQKTRNTIKDSLEFNLGTPTECGELTFDIRVYDRESDAIDQLIKRGLKDEKGKYVGKMQARQLLNEYNGIGVFRNGFRIRPLGDSDFDWLKLNEQRIQNPSLRIGSNQVIGYVLIQSEELSGLEEKSARDGLRENNSYKKLKEISLKVISELESRRFSYRQKEGLNRTALKVEREFERLFAFDEIKRGIRKKLTKSGIDKKLADDIIYIITKEEKEKNRIVDEIRQVVAIYQGQATLGKIINVILHEGRRPLNFFKNQIPNLHFWAGELRTKYEPGILNELIPITDGLGQNADVFVKLFGRLDPLAAGKQEKKKPFVLKDAVWGGFQVFENELIINGIKFKIHGTQDILFTGWSRDIYIIITNLLDNSIYWMVEKKIEKKEIEVEISGDGENLNYVDYRDTGPGIEPHLIESEVIFEPEFSTKREGGTGLGLAIAGEAALRNGLELKSFVSESGAYFRLQPKGERE